MMMNRRTALRLISASAATGLLSACFGKGKDAGIEFHRNVKRPISSTTRFDAERFAGRWVIRGEFTHPGHKPTFGAVQVTQADGQVSALDIYGPTGLLDRYPAQQTAPGRIEVGTQPFATEYWVLWVDADYRTAAIGTPAGSFGWIIDRDKTGGADRIKAARDVLGFNGYDLSRLETR